MEHSFKRRRLSAHRGRLTKAYHSHSGAMLSNEGKASDPAGPILHSQPYASSAGPDLVADHLPRSLKKPTSDKAKLSALHPRNFVATSVASSVQPPTKTVISSVVQVLVDDGKGAEVTELLVPVKSKVISLLGFAPITLANNAQSNPSPLSTLVYQSPSSTNPAASSKAAQTVQVQASRTPSNTASSSSPASSSSTSISVAESQSQAVLSSPPSTPLPSSPSSSSPSSTGSYFSASPASSSASTSPQSSTAPQSTNGQLSTASSIGNSTATIVPSTTFFGASSTSSAVFTSNVNSTLVTLTKSSSSQTSGGSLTALLSSTGSISSPASSSTRSSTTSQSQTSSSSTPTSSSSPSSTAAVIGGGVGGAGGASGTGAAPSSSASSSASSGGGEAPSTPAVVGGVVGGLAGLAIILFFLLYLLRRRRAKGRQPTISQPIPQTLPPAAGAGATKERSSVVPFTAGAFLRRMRPGSGQTAATTDTTPSERGFQNMGGRKLESVLSSRGDGYSDPVPASGVPPRNYGGTAAGLGLAADAGTFRGAGQGPSPGPSEDETLSGSSFYRDSHGFYGGSSEAAAGPSGISAVGAGGLYGTSDSSASDRDVVVTRPGPARTPVINQPGFAPLRQPRLGTPPAAGRGTPPSRTLTPQIRQQDDVGRSHPSFDGSRGSRFAEDI
ncbi:MAG: hypothetical protein Q9195_000977 [Heterodermia aff. obscurata]